VGFPGLAREEVDDGAGLDQTRHPPRRHDAPADDEDAPALEPQGQRVCRVCR
jgi:hypothetical protein